MYPLHLDQKLKTKQLPHLMMSPKMQQAIHFLQLPVMELSQVIEQEVDKNPVLEYEPEDTDTTVPQEAAETPEKEMEFDEHQFEILRQLDDEFRDHLNESGPYIPSRNSDEAKLQSFLESNLLAETSLYDHLMAQGREAFSCPSDLHIVEILIGYLDEDGFIKTPIEEIGASFSLKPKDVERILKILQTFDPVGIGSKNIQEAMLSQLKSLSKENTDAYLIIKSHFDDLLHNRLPVIQKKMKITKEELRIIIHDLAKLDFHPLSSFTPVNAPTLIPDVKLKPEGEIFAVEINDIPLRPLRMNRTYLKLLDDENTPIETKNFIKEKILSAKWLIKNISQRGETLTKISNFIGNFQKDFFASPEGKLIPLIMKVVASELGLHESTIARAISGKYIDTPRGIFPMRHFFSKSYTDLAGKNISAKTVKEHVLECIEQENKQKPLSDEAISAKIQSLGITCARRTVAKYRTQSQIGNAHQRRQY